MRSGGLRNAVVGAQMLCVAFGALVLVPMLTGLDPSVALFTAGVGTLLFQGVTGGGVPVFLASSFAFIPPALHGISTWGLPATLCGLASAGVVYVLLSGLIRWRGAGLVSRLLPPVVTGPVILSIGLILCPVAAHMAAGKSGDGTRMLFAPGPSAAVALTSLAITVAVAVYGRGMARWIPILFGILGGFVLSAALGMVDWAPVLAAPWFALPEFQLPRWSWEAIVYTMPFALAVAIEHFGDIVAIGGVTGKDYLRNPGLHRTYLGDGIATVVACCLGGPPNTTYSEVTGAVVLTRNFNPRVMTWAAIFAVALAFVAKIGALLRIVPTPVMGGILLVLFGSIAVLGIRALADLGPRLLEPRTLAVVGISLTAGLGGIEVPVAGLLLKGVSLTAVSAFALNLLLPSPTVKRD